MIRLPLTCLSFCLSFKGCISAPPLPLPRFLLRLTAMPRALRMFILHMGHVRWSSSHGSTQLLWNKCLQRQKQKQSNCAVHVHSCFHSVQPERIWIRSLFYFLISWNSFRNLVQNITRPSWGKQIVIVGTTSAEIFLPEHEKTLS